MLKSHSHQPNSRSNRGYTVVVPIVLACGAAILLYTHGVWWWYAPLAMVGIIIAHIAVIGGLTFAAARANRMRHGHEDIQSQESTGILLHNPRLYDIEARLCTLGQEKKLRQWTLELANLHVGNKVLDVGCGTGALLLTAAERVGDTGSLHGIEPSAEMRAHAQHKARSQGIAMEVVDGSADNIPYPSDSFDVVFCTLAFHHLPRSVRQDAIREMRRVLRPGGVAVIVDWQRPTSFLRALASPLFLVYLLHSLGPRDAQLDVAGISSQLKELGFEDVARHSFGPGGAVGAIVGHLAS